jgi:hypothetical protein
MSDEKNQELEKQKLNEQKLQQQKLKEQELEQKKQESIDGKLCPSCSHVNSADSMFCESCGMISVVVKLPALLAGNRAAANTALSVPHLKTDTCVLSAIKLFFRLLSGLRGTPERHGTSKSA